MEEFIISNSDLIVNEYIKPLILFGCLLLWGAVAVFFSKNDTSYIDDNDEFKN